MEHAQSGDEQPHAWCVLKLVVIGLETGQSQVQAMIWILVV